MKIQNQEIQLLIRNLQRVPYLASKNIYRVANYFLNLDEQSLKMFCKSLEDLKTKLERCTLCMVWKEISNTCEFCDDPKRDKSIICLVEDWQDVMLIERTGAYSGLYHILGGLICPLDGIGPENLFVESLVTRLKNNIAKEIIFAVTQSPEGEVTSTYIANKLKSENLKFSCLARGLPVGSSLESTDRLTVFKALSERRPF